jgi:hypothetical protein
MPSTEEKRATVAVVVVLVDGCRHFIVETPLLCALLILLLLTLFPIRNDAAQQDLGSGNDVNVIQRRYETNNDACDTNAIKGFTTTSLRINRL